MRVRGEVPGLVVHIDAEDSGEEVLVHALGIEPLVGLVALVTHAVVEVAVRAEMQVAAVVISLFVALVQIGALWIDAVVGNVGFGGVRISRLGRHA